MAKSTVEIQLDPQGIEQLFKSEQVNDALYKVGMDIADQASEASYAYLKGKKPTMRMFNAKTKRLKHTCVAIVHPQNRAAWAIQQKHNILSRFAK